MVVTATDILRPRAELAQGGLVGLSIKGVQAFRAIPYAAPPVGDRRWRPPGPAPVWVSDRGAGQVGAISVQPPSDGDPGVGPLPMSEDCLTLNVWTPEARGEGLLPIMVWIHGGGFNNGSGTAALYDGTALAKRGVVVVTINYRLGRPGFFDHPALAVDRDAGEPAGNYGLMDQIAALEWVRDNAAAFGGDPANVTIFGESAGGVAVMQLMIARSARGLFHKAVVQSGMGRQRSAELALDRAGRPSAQSLGRAWARAAGLPEDVTAEGLRAVPAEALLIPMPAFYSDNLIIDGGLLTEDVVTAFAAGRQAPVPLILGTNSAEFWRLRPADAGAYGRSDSAMTGTGQDAVIAAYGGPDGYDAHGLSDRVFNEPARHLARLHARSGQSTYLYRFDVVPESSSDSEPVGGATHASERPYVFDNLHTVGPPPGERDRGAARAMADYWTSFATTGDPNGAGRPVWPEFGAERDRLLEFTNNGPMAGPIPFADRLDLVEAGYDQSP